MNARAASASDGAAAAVAGSHAAAAARAAVVDPLGRGDGRVDFAVVAGRTRVARAASREPLRVLSPASRARAALAYVTTYGGGLVGGDRVHLDVRVGPDATAFLTTQSATKVYRADVAGRGASQSLDADVADGAALVAWPDPTLCFAGARYDQRQTFRLEAGGSLALVDCQVAGRVARGERWAFDRYRSRNTVNVAGRALVDDVTLLDRSDGPVDVPFRAGRFDALGLVVLVGPRFAELIEALTAAESGRRHHASKVPAPFVSATSRLGEVLVLRAAAVSPAALTSFLRHALAPLYELLGVDPWSRKW
jgi:urease accessory protein